MTNALSNPYELTAGGITCKASPFGGGFYVSTRDLNDLGEKNAACFKKALFNEFNAEQSRELDGIKVFGLKDKIESLKVQIEHKKILDKF